MAQLQPVGEQAARQVRQVSRRAARNPWLARLGRAGFAAQGLVYAVVGILAAQAAFGAGGGTTGTRGALQAIVAQPFGQVLLAITTVGLVGYALWRVIQAAADTEGKGSEAKGLAVRAGYLISGLAYAGLALTALRMVLGAGASGSSRQDWTARVMAAPMGRWLIGLVGLVVIGVGVSQLYRAYTAKFRERLRTGAMSATTERWVTWLGRFGIAARGVVLGIVGAFLVQAALRYDPQEARGLGGALAALAQQPYGQALLAIVALGLVAYGAYMAAEARYREMVVA